MFDIDKNKVIKLTKGDSGALEVDLKTADGTPYTMESGDELFLTVRKRPNAPVMMQITSFSNIIDFTPEKTKLLQEGSCVYDIELKTVNGDIFTVVGLCAGVQTNMIVLSEVTVDG